MYWKYSKRFTFLVCHAVYRYGSTVKVVHFIGAVKPWHASYNRATHSLDDASGGGASDFLRLWWGLFMDKVHYRLDDLLVRTTLNVLSSH